jgi:hypothetical protein
MQGHSSLLYEAPVGHVVCQRVLERVLQLGEEMGFIEELGRLEMCETTGKIPFVILYDGLK